MNNVSTVVLRHAGLGLYQSLWLRPASVFPKALRNIHPLSRSTTLSSVRSGCPPAGCSRLFVSPCRESFRSFTTTCSVWALQASHSKSEQGLSFRKKPLSSPELRGVFTNSAIPAAFANRLLRVLHGRRVDGTLDLPLPPDMRSALQRYPNAVDDALDWLRTKYDVDEDAAIIARIEREEMGDEEGRELPSQLIERGHNLGIYSHQGRDEDTSTSKHSKPKVAPNAYSGPQSGQYQAKLSEKEGDVFGQSTFDKMRAENKIKFEKEEEELQQRIAQLTDEETQSREEKRKQNSRDTALASRPEQGIEAAERELRPPNEFEKWILRAKLRSISKLDLTSPEVVNRSAASRLLPSSLFVLLLCGGLYYFKNHWTPPQRSQRVMPSVDLSFATVFGLIAINVGVFVLWRFPPAWNLLNKYFLVVPVTIQPLSLLGSVFSHTSARHLLFNMVPLLVFGPGLHEELGRAHFLTIFLASGVIGNYLSLVSNVLQRVYITSSLGASGAIWGVTAAFLNLHSNDDFTLFLIPSEWKDTLYVKGYVFFLGLIAVDVISYARAILLKRVQKINYLAHLGGAASGWLYAEAWKKRVQESRNAKEFKPKPTKTWWQHLSKGTGL